MDPQLAAIIVHDIKNSLGVLEGELRALTMESDSKRAALAHLTCLGLQEKLDRLSDVVQSVFARVDRTN